MKLTRKKSNKRFRPPKKLTIDRNQWVFGSYPDVLGSTGLLNSQGKLCCLGFYCYASGFGTNDIEQQTDPESLFESHTELKPGAPLVDTGTSESGEEYKHNSRFTTQAMKINDGPFSLKSRENRLKTLFNKYGTNLIFRGKYPQKILDRDRR